MPIIGDNRIIGIATVSYTHLQHYDVIASNIPFGDVAVFDPLLYKHEIPAVSPVSYTHLLLFVAERRIEP